MIKWTTAKTLVFATTALALSLTISCSDSGDSASTSSSTVDGSRPSTVLTAIDSKVAAAGSGLEGLNALAVDDECSEHAEPLDGSPTIMMNDSDVQYPLKYFYCVTLKNTGSPDSVRGSYTLIKSISCAMEKAGALGYDGVPQAISMTLDTDCFTADQISDMGGGPFTVTVTSSSPASFNTNYEYGVRMDVAGFGTFQYATEVTDTNYSFIAYEDNTAYEADKSGTYAASYDRSTGVLRFEARHDRLACTSPGGSCGWSRHARIYADLELNSAGSVIGVEDYQGVAMEVYDNSGSPYGKALSLKGNLTDGLKPRLWSKSGATHADLADTSSGYSESSANTKCYDDSGDSGSCTANTGIALDSDSTHPFFMVSGTPGYTSTGSWFAALTGLSFTTLNFSDTQ